MAGTLVIDTLNASSGVLATQNGMSGIAKAWMNYNGSTQTIQASFNVSSVTRTAVGRYTINFTTAMPDASYAGLASGIGYSNGTYNAYPIVGVGTSSPTQTTSACPVSMLTSAGGGTAPDTTMFTFAAFR